MTQPSVLHIVVDTNLFLHFKRLDQLDWSSCGQASERVLLLVPCVFRELEKAKATGSTPRVKQRAAQSVKWLDGLLDAEGPRLRAGLSLEFIGNEPGIDLAAHHLDRSISDDLLIAAAIELADTRGPVAIATNDTGLKMKCRQRGLQVWRPLEKDELVPEPSAEEVELKELRRELGLLRDRLPRIEVRGRDDALVLAKPIVLPAEPASIDEMRSRCTKSLPSVDERQVVGEMAKLMARYIGFTTSIAEANKVSFLRQYESFLEEEEKWRSLASRAAHLPLVLENKGTAFASHLELFLDLPIGMSATKDAERMERPIPPNIPKPEDGFTFWPERPAALPGLFGRTPAPFQLRTGPGSIQVRMDRLMHARRTEVHNLWLLWPPNTERTSFVARARILCAELATEQTMELNIVVR